MKWGCETSRFHLALFLLGCLPLEPSHHVVRKPRPHAEVQSAASTNCQTCEWKTFSWGSKHREPPSTVPCPSSCSTESMNKRNHSFMPPCFGGTTPPSCGGKEKMVLIRHLIFFSNNSFFNFSMRYVWHCLYHLFLDFLFLHRSIAFILPFFPSSLLRGLHFLWINRFWWCSTLSFWGLECTDCIHLLFFLGLWLQ